MLYHYLDRKRNESSALLHATYLVSGKFVNNDTTVREQAKMPNFIHHAPTQLDIKQWAHLETTLDIGFLLCFGMSEFVLRLFFNAFFPLSVTRCH